MSGFVTNFLERLDKRNMLAVFLLVCVAALLLFDIGGRNISSPDEGRYIEIPREMVLDHDYVLPRLNGVLYFEKPPLFYWLEASAIKTLGTSEWAMRLWPALLGIFGAVMTYGFTRRFYGKSAGVVAGFVLATSLLYYGLSRFVILDMLESVTMAASLFAFLIAAEEEDEKKAVWWARGGHIAAALAVLAKGLIGVVLPGLVGLVWIVMIGRWSFVKRAFIPSGIALFLLIAVPWHVFAAMRNQDFLWFYFVHEHLMRFTTTVHRRDGPIYYFIPILLIGFLPWTGYIWHAMKDALPKWNARSARPVEMFLILWVVLIFAFFSISDSKLPTYILPIFPPLAVLVGRVVGPRLDAVDDLPAGRWFFAIVFGLLALAVPFAYLTPYAYANEDIGPYLGEVAPYVITLAVIFAMGSVAAIIAPRFWGEKATLIAILLTAAFGWSGVSLVASVADPNSVKSLAETINKYRHNHETVASFPTFYYDLPVYIDDKIVVVANVGEFEFGESQEDVSRYVKTTAEFAKIWNEPQLSFMLIRTREFGRWMNEAKPREMCVLGHSDRAIAAANQPIYDGGKMVCEKLYNAEHPDGYVPPAADRVAP